MPYRTGLVLGMLSPCSSFLVSRCMGWCVCVWCIGAAAAKQGALCNVTYPPGRCPSTDWHLPGVSRSRPLPPPHSRLNCHVTGRKLSHWLPGMDRPEAAMKQLHLRDSLPMERVFPLDE